MQLPVLRASSVLVMSSKLSLELSDHMHDCGGGSRNLSVLLLSVSHLRQIFVGGFERKS